MTIRSVRELAAGWANASLAIPKVREDFVFRAGEALQKNIDCYFLVGPALTITKKGNYVALFAQQFFAFALSRPQAQNLCAGPNRMTYNECPPPIFGMTVTPQSHIEIHRMELDNCRCMSRLLPIQGKVQYEIAGGFTGPIAASLDYGLMGPSRTIGFFHPSVPLRPSGVMAFSFSPIADFQKSMRFVEQRTHAVFFRFVTSVSGRPEDWATPISNPLGALIDIA